VPVIVDAANRGLAVEGAKVKVRRMQVNVNTAELAVAASRCILVER